MSSGTVARPAMRSLRVPGYHTANGDQVILDPNWQESERPMIARGTRGGLLIFAAGVTLAVAGVWYGLHHGGHPGSIDAPKNEGVNVPRSALPTGAVRDSDRPEVLGSSPKRLLPSVTTDVSDGRGGYQHDQSMRRQYRPLMEQQKLAEIEAVSAAMGLSPKTIDTLKRWNDAYYRTYAAIDEQPVATVDQAKNVRKELALLRRAHTKAWLGLLGDHQSRRYAELASAFNSGQLEQVLHPDPKVPRVPVILSGDTQRPQDLGSDPSKYDSLFQSGSGSI